MWLKNTKIYRGGVTARRWQVETTDCSFGVVKGDCRFRFNIGSKGGGKTDIGVYVSPQDLPEILAAIAREVPGAAGMLSQAAADAVARLEDALGEIHKNISRCSDAVESWEESASERYYESEEADEEQRHEMDLASETAQAMVNSASILGRVARLSTDD